MTIANRMDCRPSQFKKNKYPKKTNMCGKHCPYWLVCSGISDKPKPRITKKEYMRIWHKNNKLKVNIAKRKYKAKQKEFNKNIKNG